MSRYVPKVYHDSLWRSRTLILGRTDLNGIIYKGDLPVDTMQYKRTVDTGKIGWATDAVGNLVTNSCARNSSNVNLQLFITLHLTTMGY